MPQWRDVYKNFIDLGVDIVIGHHSHSVQGWELYKDGYIFYSLGDFYFDLYDQKTKYHNKGIIVCVDINKNNKFKINVYSVYVRNNLVKIEGVDAQKNTLSSLNMVLNNNEEYESRLRMVLKELWDKRYRDFICSSVNGWLPGVSLFNSLYSLLTKFKGRFTINQKYLLYHLFMVESHRFCIENIMQLMIKEE